VFRLSQQLLDEFGVYVQPINYPTVQRGMVEMLRVAPTPHHTVHMMEYFVNSLVALWKKNGLELKQPHCTTCNKTLQRQHWMSNSNDLCAGADCDKYIQAVAAC